MDNELQDQSVTNTNNENLPVENNKKPSFLKNRRMLIGIIIAAVVVLLGVGTTLVYSLWYQNPEKIVFDSISNAIKAESVKTTGEFNVAFDEADIQGIDNVKLLLNENSDLSNFDLGVELVVNLTDMKDPLSLNGKAILDNEGNIYFNISNIEDTVDKFIVFSNDNCLTEDIIECEYYGEVKEVLNPIISKIDNQWWKVSADDLSELNEDWAEEQKCLTDLVGKINDDKKIHNEIIDLYKKNPFISINKELGVNNGNYGFEIGMDSKSAVSFVNNLDETTLFKELSNCSDSFEISEDIDEDNISDYSDVVKDNGSLVLWVSQFGHEINQVEANYKDDSYNFSANISPIFNKPVELEVPSDSKPISELVESIQEIFGGLYY